MRILLTGGAGFIGSHLAEALLERGDEVVCLDNFDPYYPRAYKDANLRGPLQSTRFRLVEGDVRDGTLLGRLLPELRPEAVVHLAARPGVRPSVEDPVGYVSVNVTGTVELLEACRRAGVEKLVFASSSSVYGNESPTPFREDLPCNRPASPYAATKKACEEILHAYHKVAGIDVVCLRYFTVYGPRQRPEMAIHKFARYLTAGRALPVYGHGRLQRDFTYVSDAIAGTLGALDYLRRARPCFEIINLADARRVALDELLDIMERAFGTRAEVSYEERPVGDVDLTWADISKARQLLSFNPLVEIEEGIERFARWFVNERPALAPAGAEIAGQRRASA